MHDITITISGAAGVGKTTLAQAISRTLSFHSGIDVVVIDADGDGDNIDGEALEERLAAVAERAKVHIITQQQRRAAA